MTEGPGIDRPRRVDADGPYVPYDQRLYDILIELFHGAAEAVVSDRASWR